MKAKVKRGKRNALFGEAVNYHLPNSSSATLPGQLYWKPEFAQCAVGEYTKPYFELFKASIQLVWIRFV